MGRLGKVVVRRVSWRSLKGWEWLCEGVCEVEVAGLLMGKLWFFSLTRLALSRFWPIGREEEEEFCSPAATRVGVARTEAWDGFGQEMARLQRQWQSLRRSARGVGCAAASAER